MSFALLTACSSKTEEIAQETTAESNQIGLTEQQLANAGIQVQKPEWRELGKTLDVVGTIDLPPDHRLSISVPIGGQISHIDLLPGSLVKKGDVLVKLQHISYIELQEAYLIQKAQLEVTQAEFKRISDLYASEAVSEKQFLQIKSDAESQNARYQSVKKRLELLGFKTEKLTAESIQSELIIYAPVNGYVSSVWVTQGDFVQPDKPIVELINPDDIHLNMQLLESDLGLLREGLEFVATSPAYPEKEYAGHILLIGKQLDAQRMVEVHAHFESFHPELIPGLFMNVSIHGGLHRAVSLPDDAIVQFGAVHYVFEQLSKTEFKAHEVNPGLSDAGYTEILSPLSMEKSFVTQGAYTLLMHWKNAPEEE
jgi:cobalt-zinc-cadmium efflux system membrane fusion protein